MPGILCLQGGREFTPECVEMDREVLAVAERNMSRCWPVRPEWAPTTTAPQPGPAGITPGSTSTSGSSRIREPIPTQPSRRCAAGSTCSCCPVARRIAARRAVRPGARPSPRAARSGTAISRASAGAMVMCSHMARPDRGDVAAGLALVDGRRSPTGARAPRRAGRPGRAVVGLPECGGVIIDDGVARGVGAGMPRRRRHGLAPGPTLTRRRPLDTCSGRRSGTGTPPRAAVPADKEITSRHSDLHDNATHSPLPPPPADANSSLNFRSDPTSHLPVVPAGTTVGFACTPTRAPRCCSMWPAS